MKVDINSLPEQFCMTQGSISWPFPSHFLPELSLFQTLVLLFVRVPIPQETEQSSIAHVFHSQVFGGTK